MPTNGIWQACIYKGSVRSRQGVYRASSLWCNNISQCKSIMYQTPREQLNMTRGLSTIWTPPLPCYTWTDEVSCCSALTQVLHRTSNNCSDQWCVTRTVHERVLKPLTLWGRRFQVVWDIDGKWWEAQIKRDTTLSALGIFVKACSTLDCTQSFG